MSKKIRYLILLTGFIFFLIAAPLALLYVRGVTYDFSTKKFVETGIMAVRTEPKNTSVYFNNKLKRTSQGDIKFVLPGEYNVSLTAEGYQPWQKRLTVLAGQVTWANPSNNSIYLFLSEPKSQTLATGVLDYYNKNNFIAFLNSTTITISNGSPLKQSDSHTLPKPVNKILAVYGNQTFVLTDTSKNINPTLLVFNSNTGIFTDLTGVFSTLPKFKFSQNGELFALSNGSLYSVDLDKQSKQAVIQNVKAFYFQGSDLYYIFEKNGQSSLLISQAPFSQSQTLLSNLPEFTNGNLLVTFGKQIFLLADGSLYKANSAMEKIADNISESNFESEDSNLAIFHLGEFDYYGFGDQDLSLVTRSGEDLKNLNVNVGIDYAFYSNNSGLNAIELDSRDSQNHYVLYSSNTIQKFTADNSGKNVLLLDNGILKSLVIR